MIELRLFGQMEVKVNGAPLRRLRSHRGLLVLARLSIAEGKPVDRALLAQLIWPDSNPSDGLYSLRRTLSDLRQAFGDDADAIVSASSTSLLLAVERTVVDVGEFSRLVHRDDLGAVDAAEWYGGPLLQAYADDWILERRYQFEALLREGLLKACRSLETQKRFNEALQAVRTLRRHEPLNEEAVRMEMNLLEKSGNRAQAFSIYEAFKQRLNSDLGFGVSDATAKVANQLAERQPAACLDPAQKTVGVIQPDPHTLIGREQELHAVKQFLSKSNIVTLTGLAGIGKTRLAREAARRQSAEFASGSWFIPLAATREPDQVYLAIAAILRPLDPDPSGPAGELPPRLGAVEALLVLDNCEHVLATARQVAQSFATYCPKIKILATSQIRLGVDGETHLRVPVLAIPPNPDDDDRWPEFCASVRLFCDRAVQAKPGLLLSEAGRRSIVQICRRLEGIPLALELAASRSRILTPVQIDELLGSKFELLGSPAADQDARHQTLQAAMAWSFDLLSKQESELLQAAAIFTGAWSITDLLEIVPAADILEVVQLIESLVDRSLINEIDQPGAPRFRLLEPVRQFARGILVERGAFESLTERHKQFVVRISEEFLTASQAGQWDAQGKRLENCLDEIAAVYAEAEANDDVETMLRIASSTWMFYWQKGQLDLGRKRAERAISHPLAGVYGDLFAAALRTAGIFSGSQADFEAGIQYLLEARQLYEESENEYGVARCTTNLGLTHRNMGQPEQAEAEHIRALEIWRRVKNSRYEVTELSNLGIFSSDVGRFEESRKWLTEAMELSDLHNFPHLRMSTRLNLARTNHLLGNLAEATELFAVAEALEREAPVVILGFMISNYRAFLLFDQNRFAEALPRLREGLECFARIGERRAIVLSIEAIGLALANLSEADEGVRLVGAAQALRLRVRALPSPTETSLVERNTRALRAKLGERFDELTREGAGWSLAEATERADAGAAKLIIGVKVELRNPSPFGT